VVLPTATELAIAARRDADVAEQAVTEAQEAAAQARRRAAELEAELMRYRQHFGDQPQ
jgi:hypothetical protein